MENRFRIAEVNGMAAADLVPLFRQCLGVERWARSLVAGRPYADVSALLSTADGLSASLSDEESRQALDDHPRIGARVAAGTMSAREQSGVDASKDASLPDRLVAANVAYEARFGHIYLVCASGRSGAELLADLDSRMGNDPVVELGVVRRELGRIARLRLAGMIEA